MRMSFARLFAPLLTLIGIAAVSGIALGQNSPVLDGMVERGTIRVGMSASQPPFTFRNRDAQLMGMEVDLANIIADGLRLELQIVERPFGRLLESLEEGEVDVVMSGMAITADRARAARFVGPYMLSGKSVITKATTLGKVQDPTQINRDAIRIGVLENSTSLTFVERALPRATAMTFSDYDVGVQRLLADEIDALVADMPICVLTVLRYPEAGFVTPDTPFTIEPIGMAVSATDAQLHSLLDNYIEALEKAGVIDLLTRTWIKDAGWIKELP